jgi:Ca2+-transporting ATPase
MGRIGASLADIDLAPTPLQRELRRLVRWLALGALAVSSLLVVWYGLRAGDWVQGLLAGIALAMALLPEEFPMVLAVFLALGAWRLARVQVLARRPAVVEALGAATVLCVDKTGTLTENRMRVHKLMVMDADAVIAPGEALPDAAHGLLEYAMLASQRGGVEPMDAALFEQGDARLAGTDHLHPRWRVAQAHSIAPDLMAVTQVWVGEDGLHRVAAKGAPEAIADLCHLAPQAREALHVQAQSLATRGLRVLAVARGRERAEPVPHAHDNDFTLLGLVAFEDPLRPSVPEAVAQAHQAGIAVVTAGHEHQLRAGTPVAEAHRRDLTGPVFAPGTAGTVRREQAHPELLHLRQHHHPQYGVTPMGQRQMHGVFACALQKILGAIKGIQNPQPLGIEGMAWRELLLGRLFAEQDPAGAGEGGLKALQQPLIDGQIGGTDGPLSTVVDA